MMDKDAIKTHGLTREKLKAKKAKKISPGQVKILLNFLNVKKDLPIVAHCIKFDRDQVLKPAFKKLEMVDQMPEDTRWRCTLNMCDRVPDLDNMSLDGLLEYFGFEPRDET